MSVTALTKDSFQEQIQNGVTLVDFWAAWCGPCKVQMPIVEQLSEEMKGTASFAKVNVDEEFEIASRFGIAGIPTMILFKDGQAVDKMVGLTPARAIQAKILEHASN
ncbi:Thioredoxin [Paenibacillus sp. CECT 9249]|uniref:thioredoxin n=1 Tax=Paenibacillus sp. CECT 9249 TaxID=2845385 RepID=UPI001E38B3F0|nr:thioredoxin [Paenibacillus sp. CECT 9249]CAH0120510.1 Thioredoxin [Paenibacillus sp. CECT 9249]